MKKYFFIIISLAVGFQSFAQKSALTIKDLSSYWPNVSAVISNDGNYVMNTFYNMPEEERNPLVILSSHSNWKMKIPGASNGSFTSDSRLAIFTMLGDSLGILTLGTENIKYIPHVKSSALPKNGTREWLAYQLTAPEKELVLCNLMTNKKFIFDSVLSYQFSDNGKALLLQTKLPIDNKSMKSLEWVSLPEGKAVTIWKGNEAGNFIFDDEATQLAFAVNDEGNGHPVHSIWYYKAGTDKAVQLVSDQSEGVDSGLRLDDIQRFSNDGNRIFFNLKEKSFATPPPNAVKVNVWSYMDPKLQSEQLYNLTDHGWGGGGPRKYAAVLDVETHHIIRLEQKGDHIQNNYGIILKDNDVLILHHDGGDALDEWNWNRLAETSVYLVSTIDGVRKLILSDFPTGFYGSFPPVVSPDGKWVVYYNPKLKNYCSYDISSGIIRNITKGINATWTTYWRADVPVSAYDAVGVAGWGKGDKAVFIYDQNDIWEIDPAGIKLPVNITNGYGKKHDIVFQPASGYFGDNIFPAKGKIILDAFNRGNKDNGFYSIDLNERGNPKLLAMQPYVFEGIAGSDNLYGNSITKAKDADIYLVQRQSASEFPNYFLTSDFKAFKQITNLQPQSRYNWMTSELITWKTLDGKISQGILYKPENFDSHKKYPVIFNYYELSSDALHQFVYPGLCYGPLNIAYYVSNGYLVFVPDIHSEVGHPGQAAYNSLVSAAQYLAKLPYVDGKHIGIQGQSFGGFETDYVITHTNTFAAACSTSGMTDFISAYGSIIGGGTSREMQYEIYRDRIGANLWQRLDLYIENSPVLRANKVTTPVLMMANPEDDDVPQQQGIEFFTALRRLGEKAWMLEYDGEGHMLANDKNEVDLTIRMKQFFDYYLKGARAPEWMVKGIPARLKGIDNGYELEPKGVGPGPGLLKADTQIIRK